MSIGLPEPTEFVESDEVRNLLRSNALIFQSLNYSALVCSSASKLAITNPSHANCLVILTYMEGPANYADNKNDAATINSFFVLQGNGTLLPVTDSELSWKLWTINGIVHCVHLAIGRQPQPQHRTTNVDSTGRFSIWNVFAISLRTDHTNKMPKN